MPQGQVERHRREQAERRQRMCGNSAVIASLAVLVWTILAASGFGVGLALGAIAALR